MPPTEKMIRADRGHLFKTPKLGEALEILCGEKIENAHDAMADVQDVLGEHHDAVVAVAWLTKTAHECPPAEAYAIGMLAQVEREAVAAGRAEMVRTAGLTYGAQGGLAARSFALNEMLRRYQAQLDSAYDFRTLVLPVGRG